MALSRHQRQGRRRFLRLSASGLLFAAAPEAPAQALAQGPVQRLARAVAVLDGAELRLEDGGLLRLEGIEPPGPALAEPAGPLAALAEAAVALLAELALGCELRLDVPAAALDRYGRLRAQAYRADDTWLQGALVSAGLARVFGAPDARAGLSALLRLEAAARTAGRGLWALPVFAVLPAAESGRALDRLQIVEGRVREAAAVRGRGYLNFGADWRRDFTATLAPAVLRAFAGEGLGLEAYRGRRVRVRGWLEYYNGPMIEITHPEQIEVLE